MIKKLDRDSTIPQRVIPNKGGCLSLSSNKGNQHPPFLGVLSENITEKELELIRRLATILVRIFLHSKNFHGGKEGSHILPSINKRTG